MVRKNKETAYDDNFRHEITLENGLRIMFHPTLSRVTYCGYAINAGTRDEKENEQGMAHFVEHTIFKGTKKRQTRAILDRLSNVGGDIDASTNKEDTIVYASVLDEDFERAVELLTDIVFHSTFPQKEIKKETEVIIDEIQSYEDTPSDLIFDEFENIIFKDHPLGRSILGNADTIRKFGTAEALSFTSRFYTPDNMLFFVSGNLSFEYIVHVARKYAGHIYMSRAQIHRLPPSGYIPQTVEINRGTHQAHVIIGCPAYRAFHPKGPALYMLNNILGGTAINNRLTLSLREHAGLVYTVESNITSYIDTGTFCIYFGCDSKDLSRCIRLVRKELKRIREKKLGAIQLHIAKQQLFGQMVISNENEENNAIDMATAILHYNRYDSIKEGYDRIQAFTADELLRIANENFGEDHLTTLIFR